MRMEELCSEFPDVSTLESFAVGMMCIPSSSSSLYIWNQGSSYLTYWQLGAWFQIYRELEDEGINIMTQEVQRPNGLPIGSRESFTVWSWTSRVIIYI